MTQMQTIPPSVAVDEYIQGFGAEQPNHMDRLCSCWHGANSSPSGSSAVFSCLEKDRPWQMELIIRGVPILLNGTGNPPKWLRPTLDGLNKIVSLKQNWDSYGSKRVETESVRWGLELLAKIMRHDAVPPLVFAINTGGIQFEWHTKELDLEIAVSSSGKVSFYRELHKSDDESDELEDELDLVHRQQEAIATLCLVGIPTKK